MITYSVPAAEKLNQIAVVHKECFPDYFITSFGEKLISNYYGEFLKESDLFVIAEDNGRVIGFCMGYNRKGSNAKSYFIKNNAVPLSLKIAFQCLTFNKVALEKVKNMFISFLKKEPEKQENPADGDLLSICVLPEYRGLGVSKELVLKFEEQLKKNKLNDYILSVYKSNTGAIKFYEKCGLKIVAETKDDEYKMYKSVKE